MEYSQIDSRRRIEDKNRFINKGKTEELNHV